jgi:hypothetical protein
MDSQKNVLVETEVDLRRGKQVLCVSVVFALSVFACNQSEDPSNKSLQW